MKEMLPKLMEFVKMNFFKIMGGFLVIGIMQYFLGCGAFAEEEVEVDAKLAEAEYK
tara:strand:- start:48 stop:215 length:168 start_codon:yes stop_codon:yes gene_type:complete